MGMFIIGIPTETEDEVRETISFAYENFIYFAIFSCMTFYPGTTLFDMYKNSPYLCKDYSSYDLSKEFSFIEHNKSKDALENIFRKAYLRFYLRPKVILFFIVLMLKNPSKLLRMIQALWYVFFTLIFPSRNNQVTSSCDTELCV